MTVFIALGISAIMQKASTANSFGLLRCAYSHTVIQALMSWSCLGCELPCLLHCVSLACEAAHVCTDKRTFKKKPPALGGERSFVQFVLDPLYKIYAQVSFPA